MQQKKKCFVIMPVSSTESCTEDEWTAIFDQMIKPAVAGAKRGFTCERATPRTGNLIKDILNELNKADVVIADLTDKNPNVFYELGVRHALRNRTILIAQDMQHVPSDLMSYWVIIYKKDLSGIQDFKDRIKRVLKDMMRNPEKPDNPVADFLVEKNVYLVSQERSANIKKLTALVSEFSYNASLLDEVFSTVRKSHAARKKEKNRGFVSNVRLVNDCLSLLLATRYIELPSDSLKELMSLKEVSMNWNTFLDIWRDESCASEVEATLKKHIPVFKAFVCDQLKQLSRVRLDYVNDNFQEETMPVVVLSSEEHRQYLEST